MFFAITFFALGIVLSYTYRKYIYENGLFDIQLSDVIRNLVIIPSISCYYIAFSQKPINVKKMVSGAVLAMIGVELFALIVPHGVIDWYAIIVAIISGVITYLVLRKKVQ